jgi:hypothetical protein
MKTEIILLGIITVTLMTLAGTAFAAKSATNLAGAQKVAWHLSGAVMPVPPYGSLDIPGSDTASKLIVNQPNGNTQMTLTGVMGGLTPDTTYTVYLSNGYTPYKLTGWDITGAWDLSFVATSGAIGTYSHHMDVTQAPDGTLTGTGYYIPAPSYTWVIDSGSYVSGNNVVIKLHFTNGHPTCWASTFTGTIDSNGQLTGTWIDTGNLCGDVSSSGTLATLLGHAAVAHSGDVYWTGQFGNTVPFTFTSNANGEASWHVNLKKADLAGLITGSTHPMSVWINMNGATILISDPFSITV